MCELRASLGGALGGGVYYMATEHAALTAGGDAARTFISFKTLVWLASAVDTNSTHSAPITIITTTTTTTTKRSAESIKHKNLSHFN